MEKFKIIVVEDDERYQGMIKDVVDTVFLPEDIKLYFAAKQMSALALIMWHRVLGRDADVIVLDGVLSMGHGRNVLRVVGKVDPNYYNKIVIFTSQDYFEFFGLDKSDESDRELAVAAKTIPFICKSNLYGLLNVIENKLASQCLTSVAT